MSDFAQRVANLSPEKRALLTLRLKRKNTNAFRQSAITRRSSDSHPSLSFAQRRLWFIDQLEPNSPAYNIPAALRLAGALDVAALERSLNEIVRRHESLRTTFTATHDQCPKGDLHPAQVIAPELTLPLPVVDLRDLPKAGCEAEAVRLATEEARRPFDLARGPLVRAGLLRLADDEHVLLFTMHHIISDGWSMGVLVREMSALYEAFSAGKPSPLPELPIQYADFGLWQRECLSLKEELASPEGNLLLGPVVEEQIVYWKQRLDGLAVLELPTDRPRPAVQSHRGAHLAFTLNIGVTTALKAFTRQEGTTLFMTLLAAFQTLLYRYTGQTDIGVGTPIANRNRSEVEGLIGFFVNTLVLRVDLSGEPGFRELLQRVREAALGAYAHQDLPFELLVDVLQPERDMSYSPLFQTMFVLQQDPLEGQRFGDLKSDLLDVETGTAKFDLILMMTERSDTLQGVFEYNTDLFDRTTIQRMVGHFVKLLEGIVSQPDQRISVLPLLTQAERQQLLVEWCGIGTEYPRDQTIQQLFEARAERTPDAIAVIFSDQSLTFRELNERANQLAHHLQALGVGPEVLVGILMERSIEMVVAHLGILKAGGAYVPLDPEYPAERLALMLQDGQVPVLLTQQRMLGRLPAHSAQVICLESDGRALAAESISNPESGATADNLAYVMYTSGSTGRPKGVCVIHRGVVRLVKGTNYANLTADEVFLQLAPISFDAATLEIWAPLLNGGRLVVMPAHAPSLAEIGQALERYQVTTLWLTASLFRLMVDEQFGTLRHLRQLLAGGDVLSVSHVRRVVQELKGVRMINGYGPTENTTFTTCYPVTDLERIRTTVPIGRPIANTRVYILDSHLQPVPTGVIGELYTGGDGLARGYLDRPDATAEKFIPAPHHLPSHAGGGRKGGRPPGVDLVLYRTGDLARYLPDGNIEFLGRMDYQVKLHGLRIELGEIEAELGRHPAVHEAVVLAREDRPGDKRLVAYVVHGQEPAPTASELRRFLKEKLPEYMVPSAFVLLDAFPLTPNGKVNRRALPEPEESYLDSEYVAPRTPAEEILAGIWAQVLGLRQVGGQSVIGPQSAIGVHDNFFELGGHSLLATQLMSRVRQVFQVELPLRSLFESPTVAELVQCIEAARQEYASQVPPIRAVPHDRDLPLSFAQQRLWFLDHLEPGSPLYNVAAAVRLTGPLDVIAFGQSLNEIVQRHEALRTVIATVDGRPVQVIAPELALHLPVDDLQHLPQTEREQQALLLAGEEARRPFDLSRGPLLRIRLLRLGDDDHIVVLTMHHIISDGWSMGVLIREIATCYQAFSTGAGRPSLPALPVQYADFSVWQQEWLSPKGDVEQGEVLETQLAYWKRQLSGSSPMLELPADRPRPSVQSFCGATYPFTFPKRLSEGIKTLAQQQGGTLFMVLLAAFQTLLHRYTGQDDICVGTPIANRNRAEIEGLIGFFVNTLVMRADFSGDPCFRELLKQVREMALGAYAHQDLPFEKLVDALQPERDMSHTPLFQVMFVLQNAPTQVLELQGLTLSPMRLDTGVATFDLTLTVEEEADGLDCAFEYNTDLFDATTIVRMTGHFQTLLEGIVANPDQRISMLPLLTEAERQQVLVEWNTTAADLPADRCVHHLFEAQVERSPDAVAVNLPATDAHSAQRLTYRELDRRANQLAHHLSKLGVGPETLVGICVERSLDMVVGLLGILKAGGAYVPLDPAYPPERLAFMLQDSAHTEFGMPVLLMHSRLRATLSSSLPASALQVVCLDTEGEAIAQESDANLDSGVTPHNLAYVIYTSGSTGQPKGVAVEHRSLVNHNVAVAHAFGLRSTDRVLQFATINFDAAAEEMFPAWLSGATVVLRPEGALVTGAEFSRLIEAEQLTVLDLPTAYWHEWVYELSLQQMSVPKSVRLLVLGGEKAEAARMELWRQVGGADIRWLNTYGPTEGTIIVTLYDPEREGGWSGGRELPIGRPIVNAQVYLLDQHLQPVPVGVPGEVCIGGMGVARGYLNRPELTAEKFIPDPFRRDMPSACLYKTGDLARYLPDGNVEFLGRSDHQVKVRGFRVELGEIEAVLGRHPAVRQAVVLCVARDEASGKQLVAYVVPGDVTGVQSRSGLPSLVGDLREFLKNKLPEYMLPSAFMLIESLPLTPSGKVDRKALPAPDQTQPELESTHVAPRTPEEETLARIWAQVLGLKQMGGPSPVGVYDNFFELGGDSILSIQVIARASQAGLHLSPRQLFEYPTVAGLAAVARIAQSSPKRCEQGVVQGSLPLTPIQRWFFEQEFPEPHHWTQSVLLDVRTPLERARLEIAVRHLLAHHDAVRLRFTRGEAGWQAVNAGVEGKVPLEWIDLSELSEADQSWTIEAKATEAQANLDLAVGPLMRAVYFDRGVGRPSQLFMVIHHLAVDTVSWHILLEDLLMAYEQSSRGEPVRLRPKTTSFQDWALELEEYAQSDSVHQELNDWLNVPKERSGRLPKDYRDRRANTEASARTVTVVLSVEETRALLHQVPAAYGTEINDTLLTALARALQRWTGEGVLLIDLEGHGREDIADQMDISRTVGWFTTVFPVWLDLSGIKGSGEALKAIKEQLRRIPHHGIGYGLLRYLRKDKDVTMQLAALPQAEVSFNYLGQLDLALPESAPFQLAREPGGPSHSPLGQRSHVIEVNGSVIGGHLQMEWTYSENLHRRATAERLAGDFVEVLRSLIVHCLSPEAGGYTPSDFPDAELTQADIEALVEEIGAA